MGYIYKITNDVNDKVYIGQTIKIRPTDRWSQHKYIATHLDQEKGISILHRAMNKYGVDKFHFEIVEEIANDQLDEHEQYWIQQYQSIEPNGYNITAGGSGTLGYSRPQTVEEKEKRRISNILYYEMHPEIKEKRSQQTKILWENMDYRQRVTESNKKFYAEHPDKFKGKNNPFYGQHHTEESLKKIHAAAKKRQNQIAQLDKDTLEIIQIFDGIKEAERALNISHGWLSKAARMNKVAYGYRWKIIQEV